MSFFDHTQSRTAANVVIASEPTTYWSQKPDTLFNQLSTSPTGLNQAEAEQRLAQIGRNVLVTRSEVTPLGLFFTQFKNPVMLILIFATMTSALLP
jgi:Mg2+-importing ATPase